MGLRREFDKHVAQLWQRDRAKLASFSINVQLYSQNHKSVFLNNPLKVLTQRNFVKEFYRENISFISKTAK